MQSVGFRCGTCGSEVVESSNHCPTCLWSRHSASIESSTLKSIGNIVGCKGLMAPIGLTLGAEQCMLSHKCLGCGFESNHRISVNDSFDALIRIPISRNEVQSLSSDEALDLSQLAS